MRRQKGFTLIELMIVVAIIGILASLAIYMFGKQTKTVSAKSEVTAIFAEFKVKQEQFRLENGTYLSSNATSDESITWPTAPGANGSKQSINPLPAEWAQLRIAPDKSVVQCAYVAVSGDANDATNAGTVAVTDFSFTAPGEDWYYLLARCDMDNSPTVDSYYYQLSNRDELFYVNQGK